MKTLRQFALILLFALAGEGLHWLLPLPVPASIYGLVLLFAALASGVVKIEQVERCGAFLLALMPVLFVAPAVNLLDCWALVAPVLLPVAAIIAVSTVVTFGTAGRCTQWLLDRHKGGDGDA